MAVGFGYIRDEQPAIVDWSAITREARATSRVLKRTGKRKERVLTRLLETSQKLYLIDLRVRTQSTMLLCLL